MKKVKLEDVAEIQVGYPSKGTIRNEKNGTHFIIQAKDIDFNGKISENDLIQFIPDRNPDLYLINKDDILFQARGSLHVAVYIDQDISRSIASSTFYVIKTKSRELRPGYLSWWLNQPSAQSFFKSEGSATVISFVSKSTLSQIMIPLPSIDVQIKIEHIKQLLQKEQELMKRLIELREKLATAVCINLTR